MTVGYPAENPGQRPRKRFDRLYHSNEYGIPLAEDRDVRKELRRICRMFGFTEDMCGMPGEKVLEMYEEDSPRDGELPLPPWGGRR